MEKMQGDMAEEEFQTAGYLASGLGSIGASMATYLLDLSYRVGFPPIFKEGRLSELNCVVI